MRGMRPRSGNRAQHAYYLADRLALSAHFLTKVKWPRASSGDADV